MKDYEVWDQAWAVHMHEHRAWERQHRDERDEVADKLLTAQLAVRFTEGLVLWLLVLWLAQANKWQPRAIAGGVAFTVVCESALYFWTRAWRRRRAELNPPKWLGGPRPLTKAQKAKELAALRSAHSSDRSPMPGMNQAEYRLYMARGYGCVMASQQYKKK